MPDSPESVALVPTYSVELGVLRAETSASFLDAATAVADPLARLIKSRQLATKISGREYVRCEGWTTLATMLGVLPREVSVTARDDGSYEAVVGLVRMSDGVELTRASAECGRDEPMWMSRAAYARRSMALTRATAKSARLAFSWIMVLAGYEATPAEEMPAETPSAAPAHRPSSSTDGPRLPGKPEKWDGNGGKLLTEIPSEVLVKAKNWLEGKDPVKNADICGQIQDALDARDLVAEFKRDEEGS